MLFEEGWKLLFVGCTKLLMKYTSEIELILLVVLLRHVIAHWLISGGSKEILIHSLSFFLTWIYLNTHFINSIHIYFVIYPRYRVGYERINQNPWTDFFFFSYHDQVGHVFRLLLQGLGYSTSTTDPLLIFVILSSSELKNLCIQPLSILSLCLLTFGLLLHRFFWWLCFFLGWSYAYLGHFLARLLFSSSVWQRNNFLKLHIFFLPVQDHPWLSNHGYKCSSLDSVLRILQFLMGRP